MLKAKLNRLVLMKISGLMMALFMAAVGLTAMQNPEPHSGSLAGTWRMTSETPSGDPVPWTLTISQKEGKWVGMVDGPDGKATPAADFKVTNNKIHMKTPYQGDTYDIDLALIGNQLTGTWSGDNGTGTTTGKRSNLR